MNSAETPLDDLVDDWLTVPDLAEALGTDVSRARHLLQERRIVAARRGERSILSVPTAFLVPAGHENPANVVSPVLPADDGEAAPTRPEPAKVVLAALQGTVTVLTDVGFTDEGIIRWLFSEDEVLDGRPIDALLTGHKTAVRRRAQALL